MGPWGYQIGGNIMITLIMARTKGTKQQGAHYSRHLHKDSAQKRGQTKADPLGGGTGQRGSLAWGTAHVVARIKFDRSRLAVENRFPLPLLIGTRWSRFGCCEQRREKAQKYRSNKTRAMLIAHQIQQICSSSFWSFSFAEPSGWIWRKKISTKNWNERKKNQNASQSKLNPARATYLISALEGYTSVTEMEKSWSVWISVSITVNSG